MIHSEVPLWFKFYDMSTFFLQAGGGGIGNYILIIPMLLIVGLGIWGFIKIVNKLTK